MSPAGNEYLSPDYIFEISWEICNKVGGIHTVLSTKARLLQEKLKDHYIMIGPDLTKTGGQLPVFLEDRSLFPLWQEQAGKEGLRIRTGRWDIPGRPITILVDFSPLYSRKNEIFGDLWNRFRLDSLTGQWDYIDPALFGYAAGEVIASFYSLHLNATDSIIAQFHEWMTGAGILYLERNVPQVATVFTTHATVLGRTLAGSGQPFYNIADKVDAATQARNFQITAKYSLEKTSAATADCFTCVSETTARECRSFLEKYPDYVTPNGFDTGIVPVKDYEDKRKQARATVLKVAGALLKEKLPEDSLLIIKSGRYEFHNKGIDVFIDALSLLQKEALPKTILAVLFVPAAHTGPREALLEHTHQPSSHMPEDNILTHNLYAPDKDAIIRRIKERGLNNATGASVKVIYAPVYLNGQDGIFNLTYYDMLTGFDLAVFPSYYEPWGYTPMESLAFHIPSLTTSLSGFGIAAKTLPESERNGVTVIDRRDADMQEAPKAIAMFIRSFLQLTPAAVTGMRNSATAISLHFTWEKLIGKYYEAYNLVLHKSRQREGLFRDKPQTLPAEAAVALSQQPVWREINISPSFPPGLEALRQLSQNVWWSWTPAARELFRSIDPDLWYDCHEDAIRMLSYLNYEKLDALIKKPDFIQRLHTLEEQFDLYKHLPVEASPSVAYFCMEYALLPAFRIYSGGLGVLAGDFLKTASDMQLRLTAVGLFYREGYFRQQFSDDGRQVAVAEHLDPSLLPFEDVRDCKGNPLQISLAFPGRKVFAKAWKVQVGRTSLYLLDTDIPENSPGDRRITSRLYPSEKELRLQQEILLGIGGIKLIQALSLTIDVYHCNEGHAAFLVLERIRELIYRDHLSFEDAFEVVKASLLFTTHTSAPAAMDTFDETLLRTYFSGLAEDCYIGWQQLMALGRMDEQDTKADFSMFHLAAKSAQEINAVSRIHRGVSAKLLQPLWRDYQPEELPVRYITNGVHYPTWAAPEWQELFREYNIDLQSGKGHWESIAEVPDARIWEIRNKLKRAMTERLRRLLQQQLLQHHNAPEQIAALLAGLHPQTMYIGFARRFTPYKRASLLFHDPEQLKKIISDEQQPVTFIFSGKAHPADIEGLGMLQQVISNAAGAATNTHIVFLEDYDTDIARLLVQGVDLWLNFPVRGKEASGTSGMKALINGVLNFSTQDGWWAEQYHPESGWALTTKHLYTEENKQYALDAAEVYSMLQHEIIPMYFRRNQQGVPVDWVAKIKKAITSSAHPVSMNRMMSEYTTCYNKLSERLTSLRENNYTLARELVAWKEKIRSCWDSIGIIAVTPAKSLLTVKVAGENLEAAVTLNPGILTADDIGVEIIFTDKQRNESLMFKHELQLCYQRANEIVYAANVPLLHSGEYTYTFRIFPKNHFLYHRTDIPLVKWT
ncbi:alpha-glucan family phosphorylase [Chitinophaga sp. CF418]|uniref:alpha-glucan family phosphorylase n=1 Tax=Chitinophaga sp. CF418 TaxID=1855287 RepID=UPI00091AF453|nr:alpha-glucan family phosphorylase [Chitinophaga sp. CF418]SHN28518.1 phosphorylase / glycogen(starch) synthase [Chitinophaga sp. CF418]